MTNGDRIEIPLFIVGAEDVPIVFSNLQVVQHEENEFILTFAQYSPPLALGNPEEQAEQIKRMPYVPVKVVARIGMTPDRVQKLMEVLQHNYQTYIEKKSRGG